MSKRLCLAAAFALTQLALVPSIGLAQAPQRITVEWQNARLSHVIDAFARFSGRTIVLAPDVGEQQVTAAFANGDWQLVLDAILEQHTLVARREASGVIRVEKRARGPVRP
jgi:ferric-dicitrate binding protein FerR (iron transport regulator)